jgi:hypothetical protein
VVLDNVEYPLVDRVLVGQSVILADLFEAGRLQRLRDAALLYPDQEALTLTELFDTLQQGIWTDVLEETRRQNSSEIPLLQRRLQRQYLSLLLNLVDRSTLASSEALPDVLIDLYTQGAPEEAVVLARYELQQLAQEIEKTWRRRGNKLEVASRSHLETAYDRIRQVLQPS